MTDEMLQNRYSNKEFLTFLKVGETLYCARDALCEFCERVMTEFHQYILTKHNIDKERSYTNHNCGNRKIKGFALDGKCESGICSNMLKEVRKETRKGFNPYWGNTDLQKWPANSWEIAKIFMGQGQKPQNKGPLDTDSSGIFHLILNCERFKGYNISPVDIDQLIEKRNTIAHAANPGSSDADLDDNITFLIKFFENLSCDTKLVDDERNAMKEAIDHLQHFGQLPFQETMQENGEFKAKMENFFKLMIHKVSSSSTKIHSQDYTYDIHLIYCADHARDAAHLRGILERFINVKSEPIRICMDVEDEGEPGRSKLDLLGKAVKSKCNFVLCNKNQSDDHWTDYRAGIAGFTSAIGEAAWTVPLKLSKSFCLSLENSLFIFNHPEIDISLLLYIGPDKEVLGELDHKQRDVLKTIQELWK